MEKLLNEVKQYRKEQAELLDWNKHNGHPVMISFDEGGLNACDKIITIIERCEGKSDSTSEKDLRVCEVIASAWISVKDRKPELKGEFPDRSSDTVLAWIPSGMILAKYLYIDEGDEGKGYVWCQVYDGLDGDAEWDDNYEVSHWCPLPDAPN
jgi:hypothetical protein